jgi:hypothetical protein
VIKQSVFAHISQSLLAPLSEERQWEGGYSFAMLSNDSGKDF